MKTTCLYDVHACVKYLFFSLAILTLLPVTKAQEQSSIFIKKEPFILTSNQLQHSASNVFSPFELKKFNHKNELSSKNEEHLQLQIKRDIISEMVQNLSNFLTIEVPVSSISSVPLLLKKVNVFSLSLIHI